PPPPEVAASVLNAVTAVKKPTKPSVKTRDFFMMMFPFFPILLFMFYEFIIQCLFCACQTILLKIFNILKKTHIGNKWAKWRREPLSLFPASYAAPILIHNACGASRKVRADISQRPFRPLGTTKHLLKKNFKRYKSLKVLSYG
ncbi:MAG: hypothetical protein IJ975_02770, partial [Clostridia bacterium]|nr:hypothetical protein [Clostridia bacterium]